MSKKGVSAVSGNISPIIGEKYTYRVVDWYPSTPDSERNPSHVTWELFKKRKNGKFTTTNIRKKGNGNFTFGETSFGNTYRLEGYLHEPEGGGLIITPKRNKIPQINKIELFYVDDTKGSAFNYTEKLKAKAYCANLQGKELNFTIWEDDAEKSGHNAANLAVESKKAKVDKNGVAVAEFMLTKAFIQKAMKGEADAKKLEFYVTVEYYKNRKHDSDNVNINNPEYKAPKPKPASSTSSSGSQNPKTQPKSKNSPASQKSKSKKEENGIVESAKELYDWVESIFTIEKDKQPAQPKVDTVSTTGVGAEPVRNGVTNGKCSRCETEIKVDQLQKIYNNCKDPKLLSELAKVLNKYRIVFKLDTCARKAHFFAQSIQEAGTDLMGALHGENLNYAAEDLPKKFRAFRKRNANEQAIDKYGNPTKDESKTVPNDLALKYGRSAQNGYVANEKKIAEIAYGKRLGNQNTVDTWLFRGRGLLQITGRGTYNEIQIQINGLAADSNVQITEGKDNDYTPKEAAVTGMADWYKDLMYLKADDTGKKKDDDVVNSITEIINQNTDSYAQRRKHYQKTKMIFEIDKCPKIKPQHVSDENKIATWRNPLDNPQITIYTQGGNKRPWRSAFGRVRTDLPGKDNGKRPHHGLDLFAKIGTPVFACLPGKIVSLSPGTGYGKGFVMKIDPAYIEIFKKQRRNYEPYYVKSKRRYNSNEYDIAGYGEFDEYEGIKESDEVYLMYAHLSELDSKLKLNEEITVESYKTRVLGKSGDTGASGTKGPHLHFEIRSKATPSGYSERYNPAYYVNYKNETQLSDTERKIQDRTAGK